MMAAARTISQAATWPTAMRTGMTNGAVIGRRRRRAMYHASGESAATVAARADSVSVQVSGATAA